MNFSLDAKHCVLDLRDAASEVLVTAIPTKQSVSN